MFSSYSTVKQRSKKNSVTNLVQNRNIARRLGSNCFGNVWVVCVKCLVDNKWKTHKSP